MEQKMSWNVPMRLPDLNPVDYYRGAVGIGIHLRIKIDLM